MEFIDGFGFEQVGSALVLKLHNPGRKNAFTPTMRRALADKLCEAATDSAVRAVVISGEGTDFCAGGDLTAAGAAGPMTMVALRERMKEVHNLLRQLLHNPKPVIAAVEGVAFGAGLSIACACDFLIAARTARFGAAFTKVGIAPDTGLLFTLPQRIGYVRAKQMMMLSRQANAEEAYRIGLADELVEAGEAMVRALEIAEEFAGVGPISASLVKNSMGAGIFSAEDVLNAELSNFGILSGTSETKEGMTAFRERRPPQFTGL